MTARHPVSGYAVVDTARVFVAIADEPANSIPVADAGAPQTVASETGVQLSAAASVDPDGDPLTYRWVQTGGRHVVLRDADTSTPTFVSPRVSETDVLTFELVVRDDKGATTLPVEAEVTVQP